MQIRWPKVQLEMIMQTCDNCLYFLNFKCRRNPIYEKHMPEDWCGEWKMDKTWSDLEPLLSSPYELPQVNNIPKMPECKLPRFDKINPLTRLEIDHLLWEIHADASAISLLVPLADKTDTSLPSLTQEIKEDCTRIRELLGDIYYEYENIDIIELLKPISDAIDRVK
jgi:hypothetical protein